MEYFLFISLFSFVAIWNIPKKNVRVLVYYFFVILVSLLAGLRGNQDEYSRFYLLIPSLEHATFTSIMGYSKEPFFTFIISLFQYLSLHPQFIFLFFSSVAVIINGYFFKKFTPFYYIAFLLYLSHNIHLKEFSGLRLGYASALILPMIYFLEKRQYFKFSMIYALSSMVQYVGLISIALIFLNREIKRIYLIIGLIVAFTFHYLNITLEFINYLNSLNLIPEKIMNYLNSVYHSYNVGLFTHFKALQQILTMIVMLILFDRYKNLVSAKIKYFNLLFNAYYLGTLLLISFSSMAIFAFRFSAHFMAVEPIILSYAIWIFKDKNIPYIVLLSGALVITYINYMVLGFEDYVFLLQ